MSGRGLFDRHSESTLISLGRNGCEKVVDIFTS